MDRQMQDGSPRREIDRCAKLCQRIAGRRNLPGPKIVRREILRVEPDASIAVVSHGQAAMEAVMADQWIHPDRAVDMTRDTGEDDAAYAAGWTISGIATLATIVAVWVFAI
jgi:hypothetical protein